jgi:K+-transporting ATPase ATPase A chain
VARPLPDRDPRAGDCGQPGCAQADPGRPGSFPTTGGLWIGLLVATILIVGGLTFLPSLALGPVADHLTGAAGLLY